MAYAQTLNNNPTSSADWETQVLEATEMCNEPSLSFINVPCIAFRAVESKSLIFARATSLTPHTMADWVMMSVDPGAEPANPCLSSDLTGLEPVITYYDVNVQVLKLAHAMPMPLSAADWSIFTVSDSGEPGLASSVLPVNGPYCVAYLRLIDGSLHLARAATPAPTLATWQRTEVNQRQEPGRRRLLHADRDTWRDRGSAMHRVLGLRPGHAEVRLEPDQPVASAALPLEQPELHRRGGRARARRA